MNYYNEHDPKTAEWLRELMKHGHIPQGHVDERSIVDVQPADLAGYCQCHFFAGIGGWPLALRLAGWPDDREVWTGSCPCQPFSAAGKNLGTSDPRHLWPQFLRLIAQRMPSIVFGEQVASKAGRLWLDGVRADLEALDLAFGAADLCAAGIGAPHIRQRLWWVAYAADCGRAKHGKEPGRRGVAGPHDSAECNCFGGLAYAGCSGDECGLRPSKTHGAACEAQGEGDQRQRSRADAGRGSGAGRMADSEHAIGRPEQQPGESPSNGGPGPGRSGGLGDALPAGFQTSESQIIRGSRRRKEGGATGKSSGPFNGGLEHSALPQGSRLGPLRDFIPGPANAWSKFDLIPCRDGKARRVESGTFPLAYGIPGRVGLLRGYGNAIVPQLAAQFIQAAREVIALM